MNDKAKNFKAVLFILFLLCGSSTLKAQVQPFQAFVEDSVKYGPGRVYKSPEITAAFPGGKHRMYEYIKMKLESDAAVSSNPNLQGSFAAEFIIEKTGKVQYVHVIESVSEEYDEEVVKALLSMPKWKPADENGGAVRSMQVYRVNLP